MSTDPDTILLEAEESMIKAVEYLTGEFSGIRAGRASPAMVEYIKVECYGSETDLKGIAAISIPEPSQILIKPYDASLANAIRTAIELANIGVNPIVEDKKVRLSLPMLTTERRQQLVAQAKKVGEEQKVVFRNTRRDANKHADSLAKQDGTHYSEDEIKTLHTEIQDLLKKYEAQVDGMLVKKTTEITTV